MKAKPLALKKSERRFELEDGGVITRQTTEFLPDKTYFFEDELDVKDYLEAKVITCSGWLLEIFELESGEIFFASGAGEIHPRTNRFGVFYSPFSFTQPCFRNAKARLFGIAGRGDLPAKFLSKPFIFETDFTGKPANAADVGKILNAGANPQVIERNPLASLISLKAKRLIDENYQIYPSIARIAARLNVSHEHLSRQFKHDFGMSPSAYLREIRVSDATFRLAQGEEIINVSHDVGYNDLSRFYKQFRKTTNASPGRCQKKVSRIIPEN
jgi:AraC-like DNA-binding protein